MNHERTIIQIVPRLEIAHDGVGDHALSLAGELLKKNKIRSVFLDCKQSTRQCENVDGFEVRCLLKQTAESFSSEVLRIFNSSKTNLILLHYSGYGYQKRGVPHWLISGVEKLKKSIIRVNLFVMFHETYAVTCKPWTSSFWNQREQRFLIKKLAALSDVAITSNEKHRQKIYKSGLSKEKVIYKLPVSSNVGELNVCPDFSGRQNSVIYFGLARHLFYSKYLLGLQNVLRQLQIFTLHDVGPQHSIGSSKNLSGLNIIEHGVLPSRDVSDLLKTVKFGFIICEPDLVEKSTVYAAYCAHGVIPIIITSNPIKNGLPGILYSDLEGDLKSKNLESESIKAFLWYQDCKKTKQADFYANLVKS